MGLGKRSNIGANFFKTAHDLAPDAILFANDGDEMNPSPDKYIEQISALQQLGAPISGIGLQGHLHSPVGSIVCATLDKLGVLGLPIWFTAVDVCSINEHVRADDLEVVLREVFAHPSVERVMLSGFWELFMSRENSHLVNAEGEVNEAGKRLLELKEESLSRARGHVDKDGEFMFRGFYGAYEVVIVTCKKTVSKTFVVDKDESSLVVNIDI